MIPCVLLFVKVKMLDCHLQGHWLRSVKARGTPSCTFTFQLCAIGSCPLSPFTLLLLLFQQLPKMCHRFLLHFYFTFWHCVTERSPVWNQTCVFEVDEHTTPTKCIIVQVYDTDDVGNKKQLGECYISWEGLNFGEEKVCYPVAPSPLILRPYHFFLLAFSNSNV